MIVRFPWGTEKMGDPANPARWFCWHHYVAGHRYFVTASAVVCECGDSFTGPTP